MIRLIRTDANHYDFTSLIRLLDDELKRRHENEFAFYAQFNTVDHVKQVLLAYEDEKPLACGAIRKYRAGVMEVKRIFVLPSSRRKGLATKILLELEEWGRSLSYHKCIVKTSVQQPEAIALYAKNNYRRIPNYGPYHGVVNSVCFEKNLQD